MVYKRSMPGRAMRLVCGCLIGAALLLACDPPPPAAGEFIAIESDFAGFDRWTAFDRGPQPVGPMHPDGSSDVFIDALPPPGATSFPIGTIIVRRTSDASGTPVEIHGMVKRGGRYNEAGAVGWEFFDLAPSTDDPGRPVIRWRGLGPTMGDGYTVPDGGTILSCNHCHASFPENDSVLGPELDLTSL